jgi:hypothetical protein
MIYDNNTGGNIWFYGELQNSINVQIDSCGIILANTNQFSFDICGGSTTDMTVTSYASNKILNYIFGNSPTLVMPANFYMGVSSTALNIEGIGATEPTGGGYQRLVIPNDKNSFSAAANKTVTFAKEFQFPNSTSPWGDMTHWFISDTPTGENVWWNGKLIHHRNVEISTTLSVIPNAFNWVLDTCGLAVTP